MADDTNKKEEVSDVPVTTNMDNLKKHDFRSQLGSAAVGAVLGTFVCKKLTDNKLVHVIGLIAGSVIMHKVGPEIARDFAGAADNTKQKGCDGIDKFKNTAMAFGKNLLNTKGQTYTGDMDCDA